MTMTVTMTATVEAADVAATSCCSKSSSSSNAIVKNLELETTEQNQKSGTCRATPRSSTYNSSRPSYFKSRKPSARGRRVTFCDKGHTCEFFDMYTDEEGPEVWFSCADYDDMKSKFEFTIFMMDAGCPEKVEDDEHTTRGLEKRSEEGSWKRYERKRDYYNAVLDEQERQWDANEDDQDKIGQIAAHVTRESRMEAYDQGVLDEIAVYGNSLRLRKELEHEQELELELELERLPSPSCRQDYCNSDVDIDGDADGDELTATTDVTFSSASMSVSNANHDSTSWPTGLTMTMTSTTTMTLEEGA